MTHSHSITSELELHRYHASQVILSLSNLAGKNQLAVALWKLPGESRMQLIIDTGNQPAKGKVDLEETCGGFLVAPFQNPGRTEETYLKADLYYNSADNKLATGRTPS
jgi:hypothetical protein